MTYFSVNEVRDYLTSRGLTTTEATYIQTYAERMVAAFVPTGRNASLVNVFETVIRPIMPICAQTYGLGLNAAQVKEVIRVNFPDFYPVADTYKNIIVTDINTNLVGTPAAADNKTAKETYLAQTATILTKVAKYMRHFAGLDTVGLPLGELFVSVPM
jgi:hypothetical protein